MFNNALVSVSDKSGLAEFLKPLVDQGLRVVSTGGTASYLEKNGIPVVMVKEQTGYPEVMDGRVKTLHPRIHMCLLARSQKKEDLDLLSKEGLEPFDLVIGNLYPFEENLNKPMDLEERVELIDIGGPSLLRAAAKNFSRITVVTDPQDYDWILSKGEVTESDRKALAAKVFSHVSRYDSLIASYLGQNLSSPEYSMGGTFVQSLRYGENPQQQASWYSRSRHSEGLQKAQLLQGKELSYNNLLDLDAAVETLSEFSSTTCVAVKHNNPCGVARRPSIQSAVQDALSADPVSVFGGIIAATDAIDKEAAESLVGLFLECVVAPDYSPEALEVLGQKKNLRILKWPDLMTQSSQPLIRSLRGGFLVQTPDEVAQNWNDQWEVLASESLSKEVQSDLLMAWKVCAHLKSNAIAIVSDQQTVGLGMGQVNRVDAVSQAIYRMNQFHSEAKENLVLASDAFFPFPDSIERAAEAGVRWVIQPGGSIKDEDVKQKAKELGVGLVLTGQRHFLH